MELSGCTFHGCVVIVSGNVLFVLSYVFVIVVLECVVVGGALYFWQSSNVMLSGCTFDGCVVNAIGD